MWSGWAPGTRRSPVSSSSGRPFSESDPGKEEAPVAVDELGLHGRGGLDLLDQREAGGPPHLLHRGAVGDQAEDAGSGCDGVLAGVVLEEGGEAGGSEGLVGLAAAPLDLVLVAG